MYLCAAPHLAGMIMVSGTVLSDLSGAFKDAMYTLVVKRV